MNESKKTIIRKLQWIFYPVATLLLLDFILRFFKTSSTESSIIHHPVFEFFDTAVWFIVFIIMGIVVAALIQQFFSKRKTASANEASLAPVLLKIERRNKLTSSLLFFITALGFSVLLNMIVFSPSLIFDEEQIKHVELLHKLLIMFFYVITHFLVLVSGVQLFKGIPPVFIATEKGFCYEPAGISSGWILWKDVMEVRESTVLSASSAGRGPFETPVIGISLKNPEQYAAIAYAPLLQKIANKARELNNFQTEGVGDLLLNPADFGDDYQKVKTLLMSKSFMAGNRNTVVS